MPTYNELFMKHLGMMHEIHSKKQQDYAAEKWNDNFTRTAEILSWFHNPVDGVYAGLIGVKLARLANLLNKEFDGKDGPVNESILDSFLDLNTYCNLFWCDYEQRRNKVTPISVGPEVSSDSIRGESPATLRGDEAETYARGGEYKGKVERISPRVYEFAKFLQVERINSDEAAFIKNILNNTERR